MIEERTNTMMKCPIPGPKMIENGQRGRTESHGFVNIFETVLWPKQRFPAQLLDREKIHPGPVRLSLPAAVRPDSDCLPKGVGPFGERGNQGNTLFIKLATVF